MWAIFCFSWPFISLEAQRKSQYAKLLQFFVAKFDFEVAVGFFFLIEWPSFVAFIWALSVLFDPCRLSEFTLTGPPYS